MFVYLVLFVAFILILDARSKLSRLERRVGQLNQYALTIEARIKTSGAAVAPEPDQAPVEAVTPEPEPDPVRERGPQAEPVPEPAPEPAPTPVRQLEPVAYTVKVARVRRGPAPVLEPEATVAATAAAEPAAPPEPDAPEPPTVDDAPVPPVAPAIEPLAQLPVQPPARRGWSFNFEDLFGRRLPIWAGGITLAIAGVLIVKYALDAGILKRIFTPWVQVISGFLFGGGLIAAAEAALRNEERVQDPRVGQALSGAGIATLYAAILVASNGYGLIGPLAAFAGLSLVTAAAIGLSIRFGVPSALLGLAGGLAAPALTGSLSQNVPLLSVYLGFTIAGLTGVSRMQRWPWLALTALIGGAGWSLWMILASNTLDLVGSLSIGGFTLLLAIALPMLFLDGARATLMRVAAAVVGAAQLAILVAIGGFEPLHWGLFGLLAAAGQWLAWRHRDFDIVPTISASISVLLLAIWPDPGARWFAIIGLGLAAIHLIPLVAKLWRTPPRVQFAMEISALSLAALALPWFHFRAVDGAPFTLIALGAALVPALAIGLGWRREDRTGDARLAWMAGTLGILLFGAFWFATPVWVAPLGLAAITVGMLYLGKAASDERVGRIAESFAAATIPMLMITMPRDGSELFHLVQGQAGAIDPHSVLRWGGLSALFLLFGIRGAGPHFRTAAQAVAGALAYGMLAQMLPGWSLPLALAAVAAALLGASTRFADRFSATTPWAFAVATPVLLIVTGTPDGAELVHLFAGNEGTVDVQGVLRWGGLAALFGAFAQIARNSLIRVAAFNMTAAFIYGMIAQAVPGWSLPIVLAGVAAVHLMLGQRREQANADVQSALFAAAAIPLLSITGHQPIGEWSRLVGAGGAETDVLSVLRWASIAALGGLFAIKSQQTWLNKTGQVMAALFGYGAVTQAVPLWVVPVIAPLALAALMIGARRAPWPQLAPAAAVLGGILLGWAAWPLMTWGQEALTSLGGMPMWYDAADLSVALVVKRLLVPAALIFAALRFTGWGLPAALQRGASLVAAIMAGVAIHTLYRAAFAVVVGDDFISHALGQRLVWSGALVAAGWLAWRQSARYPEAKLAATGLAMAGILHTLWYSLLMHNPLWQDQAVGTLPVANLLLPLFAIIPAGVTVLLRLYPAYAERSRRAVHILYMVLCIGFAWASLRQIFHGTLLTSPGLTQPEDISRSILGIGLAIGFLLWGTARHLRDWRIASLVLILAATVKVFLFDASGLTGLVRIGSFVALGFSLIGIGWFYSRQLRRDAPAGDGQAGERLAE